MKPKVSAEGANLTWQQGQTSRVEREQLLGHGAMTIWLTGLSGAGKSTLAFGLERQLLQVGCLASVLDGDNLRHGLNKDLTFLPLSRTENIRRVAEVARLFNEAGVIVICAFISPTQQDREQAKTIIGDSCFLEVHVSTPLVECERRDPKGLYQKARNGELKNFTGVDAPYEVPVSPDIVIDTSLCDFDLCVRDLFSSVMSRVKLAGVGGV